MVTTTCAHQEQIENLGNGIQHGTCKTCGQVRRYNTLHIRDKPKIIKLGRINGAIVLPGNKDELGLPSQEATELEAAKKEPAPADKKAADISAVNEEKPQLYVGKPQKYQRGIRKWRTRCKSCKFGYFHDEILWCSSKRCPQWCPLRLRPPYGPSPKPKRAEEPKKPLIAPKAAPENLEDAGEVCAGCPVLQAFKGYRMAVNDILGKIKKL